MTQRLPSARLKHVAPRRARALQGMALTKTMGSLRWGRVRRFLGCQAYIRSRSSTLLSAPQSTFGAPVASRWPQSRVRDKYREKQRACQQDLVVRKSRPCSCEATCQRSARATSGIAGHLQPGAKVASSRQCRACVGPNRRPCTGQRCRPVEDRRGSLPPSTSRRRAQRLSIDRPRTKVLYALTERFDAQRETGVIDFLAVG